MTTYRVVRKAKDGSTIGVGTLRTRKGKPIEVELRAPVVGRFEVVLEEYDDEPTVPRGRPKSRR